MTPKPKLHKYIVRLPDGKEILVKAHDVRFGTNEFLWFRKNEIIIIGFKEWIFWRKI